VAPDDLMDREWLIELTKQVHHLRFIASGGVLKDVLRETEESDADLMLLDNESDGSDQEMLYFDWRRVLRRYVKRQWIT